MSRLLFAAARGARLQIKWSACGQWETTHMRPIVNDSDGWRIYPDDKHLQYGPISTAFRHVAEIEPPPFPDVPFKQGTFYNPYSQLSAYCNLDTFSKSIACLLLAEYLADEGL